MPVVNPLARELVFKVVYYGPGLGGKTTSLQYLHATAKPEHRGKLVSLATPVDRTLYFDFLPIRVPNVRGMAVRLQLFTVPGQVYYNATRKLVLTGADGVVSVFDSQRARSDANLESLENLIENLRAHGRDLASVPHIIQYNKRDLYDVAPIDELERQLNLHNAPSFATTATSGEGIYEALEAITRAVLEDFERRMPDTRGLPAAQLELPEGGLVDALRRAEGGPASDAATRTLPAKLPQTTSSMSGEHRLSQLPEVEPGEAAARAVAGQPDELVPRPRQTWPLPGAPDESRYSTAVAPEVANALPLSTSGAVADIAVPPLSEALSQVNSVVEPPPPPPEPRPAIAPAPTSTATAVAGAASPVSEAPSLVSEAPSPVSQAAAPISEVAAPISEGSVRAADISPAAMSEPPRKPRSSPPEQVASVTPITGALSFEQLWPAAERSIVRELESSIAAGNTTRAITLSEQLVARSLAGAASSLGGTPDAPRDPLTVVLVLGIDRRRYLEYRALVRDARSGRTMSPSEALVAYALAIETRLSRLSLTG